MFEVLVSQTFSKQFKRLSANIQSKIKKGLKELEKDPREPRPGANIQPLTDTKPPKHRLRVGEYRIIYCIEDQTVKVIEVFKRGRGYRK